MIVLETVLEWAKPWAKDVVQKKFIPYIQELSREHFLKGKKLAKVSDSMIEYLAKTKAQCSVINTLAFPNILKKINDIYEPLFLTSMGLDNESSYKITDGSIFVCSNSHSIIIDNAGMGKSTLMRKMVIDTINKTSLIPIYIELRSLEDEPLVNNVKRLLGLEPSDSDDIIKNFSFSYFLDGIDEINHEIKDKVIKRIREFSEIFQTSKIIITSRPDNSLIELYGFSRYKIKPLVKEQSYSLLSLYDNNSQLSKKLINEIEGMKDKDSIAEFLTTPLYVSLLFCAYRHKPVVPKKKDLFYSQVYEALFESHDLSKENGYVRRKASGLDITEFSTILRRLGFWCLKNGGKLEFSRTELEKCLDEIITSLTGIQVKPRDFMYDMIINVPLFIKEGALYRWSHKSLMEYFSAEFICLDLKEKQTDILYKIYLSNDPLRFKNVLELCADIDYTSFRRGVMRPCLKEYLAHIDKIKCNNELSNSDIEIWASITFFSNMIINLTSYRNANLSDISRPLGNLKNTNDIDFPIYENTYIGYEDYIVNISFSSSLKNTIFEILKWKNNDHFYNEKFFYERKNAVDSSITPEINTKVIDGFVLGLGTNPQGIIDVLLHFRHALSLPIIKSERARYELKSIEDDETNGIDGLLLGFN